MKMATRKSTATPPTIQPTELKISRDDAKSRLEDRIQKGREIRQSQITDPIAYDAANNEVRKWNSYNDTLLKQIFTTPELAEEYSYWGALMMSMHHPSLGEKIADLYKDVDKKIHRIDSIIDRLELIPLHISVQPVVHAGAPQQAKSNKVFIVHGHDEVAKTSLEVFLHENGLEPVVLHRQADQGLTIIEKFEQHSDVGYAFILLTPDEVAYLATEETKPDQDRLKEFRARPNVIFEFGYFVAKLGRSRVCCLHTGNVSLPSDVNGMIYKKYVDSIEEAGYGIQKDLRAAGLIS
jgi:predicted nucleotide-binding protein